MKNNCHPGTTTNIYTEIAVSFRVLRKYHLWNIKNYLLKDFFSVSFDCCRSLRLNQNHCLNYLIRIHSGHAKNISFHVAIIDLNAIHVHQQYWPKLFWSAFSITRRRNFRFIMIIIKLFFLFQFWIWKFCKFKPEIS